MTEGNLEIFRHSVKEGFDYKGFLNIALESFEQKGMLGGYKLFRESVLRRVPKHLHNDPNIERFAVISYNNALKSQGVDDELGIYYHYTSEEGKAGIQADEAIKAMGEVWHKQVSDGFQEGGIIGAVKAFFIADNLEKVGIHVASDVPPEVARPNYTNLADLFAQRVLGLIGQSKNLGIPKENLKHYYTIVTPASDKLFYKTIQSQVPGFGLNERRSKKDTLSLNGGEDFLITGPFQRIDQGVDSIQV